MRTTLTLDDDVAALLARVRKCRNLGLKEAVNEALRHGLRQMAVPSEPRRPYRTRSVDGGKCLVADLDNIAEVLAVVEGEAFR
jgi:hypothetical protein